MTEKYPAAGIVPREFAHTLLLDRGQQAKPIYASPPSAGPRTQPPYTENPLGFCAPPPCRLRYLRKSRVAF